MAKTIEQQTPAFISELLQEYQQRIPDAIVDTQRLEGLDHYFWRIAIVSGIFRKMDLDDRHDLAWGIARERMQTHRVPRISMILCLTPEEFHAGA